MVHNKITSDTPAVGAWPWRMMRGQSVGCVQIIKHCLATVEFQHSSVEGGDTSLGMSPNRVGAVAGGSVAEVLIRGGACLRLMRASEASTRQSRMKTPTDHREGNGEVNVEN